MRVYGCQMDIAWEDKRTNFATARRLAEQAAPKPGSLFVLPEMFATGFSMNVQDIAEEDHGETTAFAAGLARDLRIVVMAGVTTRESTGKGRNEAIVFSPDGVEIARYSKIQPFSPGGESSAYRAGDILVQFEWQGITVAPYICYDLRFPEIFRPAGRKGVELFTVIASWPVARAHHWVTLLQARAIENQAYVLGVNRCGTDPSFEYPGRSIIVDPGGIIIADAGSDEAVIHADLDIESLRSYRRDKPFLADMREDFVVRT